jgi:predicted GNAT family N-acyltransferase
MIRGVYLTSKDDLSEVIALRREVFVCEQGYSPESEPDRCDEMAMYALVYGDDGAPIATGRLYVDEDRLAIGRVCVKREWRGKGVGDFAMRMLLSRARELNAGSVTLSAQIDRVGFYERYGFEPYGEIVYDEGRPHRMMRVMGDKINLEGACGGQKACDGCAGDCGACENG